MGGRIFDQLDEEGRALHDSWDNIARVMFVVAMMSGAVWAVCAALRWVIHGVGDRLVGMTGARGDAFGWAALFVALALAGLVRGYLTERPAWRDAKGDGVNVALSNYHVTYDHDGDDPQPRYDRPAFGLALRKAIATALTLGSGASGGLEAPVVLIGESMGAGWSRVFRARSEHELRTYQLAGIAAAVGTLIGAPFTAALFAIEIAYGDRIIYRKFAYCLLAAIIVFALNQGFLRSPPLFIAPPNVGAFTVRQYAVSVLVAVAISAPVALGFGRLMTQTGRIVDRTPPLLRGPAGGVAGAVVALGLWLLVGMAPHHVLGMGTETLRELLSDGAPELSWWILLLAMLGKMVATGFTIRSGGSAGILIPAMYLGGVSGAATGKLLELAGVAQDISPQIFVVVGVASALVAVIGVPLAAIALVLEVFGATYGPPAILACGVTYVLSLRLRVYQGQRMAANPDADETGAAP
ncbi:MAG: chloride channel protein [Labilithrix sp.]|nr:chloride channel protein [Labilithrix sp.]